MRVTMAARFGLTLALAASLAAQDAPPPPAAGRGGGGRRAGGFVPGQQRPPGDPVQIARGKTLYGISCTGCHGADLRWWRSRRVPTCCAPRSPSAIAKES